LTGKEVHDLVLENNAEVNGVHKTKTLIIHANGSDDAKKHFTPTEYGSLGNKMRSDYPVPFESYPDGKKVGTPIPPPRIKKSISQPVFLRKSSSPPYSNGNQLSSTKDLSASQQ